MSNGARNLAVTVTGEIYQPIRLYYRIYDRKLLLKQLKKLKCTHFDSKRSRWAWFYSDECKNLAFKNSYHMLPKECQDNLVLGSFYFHGNSHICLDVPSHERAIAGLEFFNEQIPTTAIKVEHADVINCLFEIDEIKAVNLSTLLDNPYNVIKNMPNSPDAEYPIIEVLLLNFYEDGIDSVKTPLLFRQIVGKEHWLGNTKFTTSDLLNRVYDNQAKQNKVISNNAD